MTARKVLTALSFALAAAGLALVGGWFGVWQAGDHLIFRALYLPEPPSPAAGVRLIDIEYPDELRADDPKRFRAVLGEVLKQLAELPDPPDKVILDIFLAKNTAGEEAALEGIAALQKKHKRVLAAVDPRDRQGAHHADYLKRHNKAVYATLDGHGHTQLEYSLGVLTYRRELVLPVVVDKVAAGTLRLPALPILAWSDPVPPDSVPDSLVIPIGDDARFAAQLHRVALERARLDPPFPQSPASPRSTHVIIGSFAADSDNALGRPGPYLLAWALSDLLAGKMATAREPLNHPAALLGLITFASLVAFGSFALAFRVYRGRVVPSKWPALANWVALGSFLLAVAALLVLGGVMLIARHVIPTTLPIACAALAAAFALRSAHRHLAEDRIRREIERTDREQAKQWDVFISYAHEPAENKAWVKENVYEPIGALRHPDGKPYRVFFDESAIAVGREWKREIELSLLGTRFFVPVYSELYFERPYCREEIEIADQLRIEKRLDMLPVARSLAGVPERYLRKVQYIDVSTRPDAIQKLIEQISSLASSPAGAPPAGSNPSA